MPELTNDAVTRLERIARAIRELEGVEIPYGLAIDLSRLLRTISEYCHSESEVRHG